MAASTRPERCSKLAFVASKRRWSSRLRTEASPASLFTESRSSAIGAGSIAARRLAISARTPPFPSSSWRRSAATSPSRPARPAAVVDTVDESVSSRCVNTPTDALRSSMRLSMFFGSFCAEIAASALRSSSTSAPGGAVRGAGAVAAAASTRANLWSSSRRRAAISPSFPASADGRRRDRWSRAWRIGLRGHRPGSRCVPRASGRASRPPRPPCAAPWRSSRRPSDLSRAAALVRVREPRAMARASATSRAGRCVTVGNEARDCESRRRCSGGKSTPYAADRSPRTGACGVVSRRTDARPSDPTDDSGHAPTRIGGTSAPLAHSSK